MNYSSININNFSCDGCNIKFSCKWNKTKHEKSCKSFMLYLEYESRIEQIKNHMKTVEKEIEVVINENFKLTTQNEEQRLQISELKEKIALLSGKCEIYRDNQKILASVAKQQKQTYNHHQQQQININLVPYTYTQEEVKEIIERAFTDEVFDKGQKGVAEMTFKKLLFDPDCNSKYVVSNYDNDIFSYKNADNEMKTDVKAIDLTAQIFPIIKPKSKLICDRKLEMEEERAEAHKISQEQKFSNQSLIIGNHNEIMKIKEDPRIFVGELKIWSKTDHSVLRKEYLDIIKKENEEKEKDAEDEKVRIEMEKDRYEEQKVKDLEYNEEEGLVKISKIKEEEGDRSLIYRVSLRIHRETIERKLKLLNENIYQV